MSFVRTMFYAGLSWEVELVACYDSALRPDKVTGFEVLEIKIGHVMIDQEDLCTPGMIQGPVGLRPKPIAQYFEEKALEDYEHGLWEEIT